MTLRSQAKNDFEKNFFKLMCNSIFGRSIMNKRNFIDFQIVKSWHLARKRIAENNFHRCVIFDKNFVGFHMKKIKVILDNPIYIGFCVLDLAKLEMQEFHYNVIQSQDWKANLLYTDTDSLVYEIYHDDVYQWMKSNIHHFDTSDYPANNFHDMPRVNKKVVLKMKDECNGVIIREFIAVRPKLYAFQTEEEHIEKRARGITRDVLDRQITYGDYYSALHEGYIKTCRQTTIQSKDHFIFTLNRQKVAIDPSDDKRILAADFSTLPYGHKDIRN